MMATQGLLTVMSGDEVVIKVITGSDGYNIPKLKDWIIENPEASAGDIYAEWVDGGLGSHDSFVVQTLTHSYTPSDLIDLGPLYAEKFNIPDFNPRWERGTADFVEIIIKD